MNKINLRDFVVEAVPDRRQIVIIGLGATGSAFLPHLAHFLRYNVGYQVTLCDFDTLEDHNNQVSYYLFREQLDTKEREGEVLKAHVAREMLYTLLGNEAIQNNDHIIKIFTKPISLYQLALLTSRTTNTYLDYIFVFADNPEVRNDVAKYHSGFPRSIVFDVRIGSYRDVEIIASKNPHTYAKTILKDKETGKVIHIETNNVCLNDRMSFSMANTGSSILYNLFTQHLRDDLAYNNDFYHLMLGQDYKGVLNYK